MAHEQGYRCPYSGEPFTIDQLVGYGQPPRSPGCPVGYGAGSAMVPIVVNVKRNDLGQVTECTEEKGVVWSDMGKSTKKGPS